MNSRLGNEIDEDAAQYLERAKNTDECSHDPLRRARRTVARARAAVKPCCIHVASTSRASVETLGNQGTGLQHERNMVGANLS